MRHRHAVVLSSTVMTSRLGVRSATGARHRGRFTTLGKYLGGGLSFGASVAGRHRGQFDQRGRTLPHAGTFNNNIVTMSVSRG
jgi:glutamate-1-semialdehyde 2,1-aminomutase